MKTPNPTLNPTPLSPSLILTMSVFNQLVADATPKFKSLPRAYLQSPTPAKALPWPETPFPLIYETGARKRRDIPEGHYCIRNAQIMAQTHNTIFRGLNAIYHQAKQIAPGTKDAEDLLLFCSITCDFIHCHHHAEEEAFFPGIEEAADTPGLMDGNIEQHRCLEEALERLRKYTTNTNKHDYNAEELRYLIDRLAGPLGSHMHEEIPSILDLHKKVPSSLLEKIYGQMHHIAATSMDSWK
jgi:sterol-4alpha-carboxylate 3-dehydrogenase (decarboxylating)